MHRNFSQTLTCSPNIHRAFPLITEILLHQHLSAVGGRRDEAVSTSHTATSLSLIQPFPGRLETGAVGGKLQQALSHAALLPIWLRSHAFSFPLHLPLTSTPQGPSTAEGTSL